MANDGHRHEVHVAARRHTLSLHLGFGIGAHEESLSEETMRLNPVIVATASTASLATLVASLAGFWWIGTSDRSASDEYRRDIAQLRQDVAELDRQFRSAGDRPFSEKQQNEITRLMKEHLRSNPDLLQEILAEIVKKKLPSIANRSPSTPAPDRAAAIRSNAPLLLNSSHQVVLGNPDGDVTLVEFFDYNCGFCKRALSDTIELLASDKNLKVVLKEYPILGPGSMEAARVGIALRMQDPSGQRYLEFHRNMLSSRVPANTANALAVAESVGADMDRLRADLSADEVGATLDEVRVLTQALGLTGTPAYVVGTSIVPGAVGLAALKERVAFARAEARP
jgi:protein-disulfide isomerase